MLRGIALKRQLFKRNILYIYVRNKQIPNGIKKDFLTHTHTNLPH